LFLFSIHYTNISV